MASVLVAAPIQTAVHSSDYMLVKFDDCSGHRVAIFRERIKQHLISHFQFIFLEGTLSEDHQACVFCNAFQMHFKCNIEVHMSKDHYAVLLKVSVAMAFEIVSTCIHISELGEREESKNKTHKK